MFEHKMATRRLFESAALNINWFPGHMASAARKIEQRLKVADMVPRALRRSFLPCCLQPCERALRRPCRKVGGVGPAGAGAAAHFLAAGD